MYKFKIYILLLVIIIFIFLLLLGKTNEGFRKKEKEKTLVCFFGVIPRSIKYTWNSIKENIIDPLETQYDVDIYIFNMNLGDTKIDGILVNQDDIDMIPYTYKEEDMQKNVDLEIDDLCKNVECKFRDYDPELIRNALRQMYSEHKVGLFLEKNKNKYNKVLICGPDYYIANKLNIHDFNKSENYVYRTIVNNGQGYTNGLFFGNINLVIPILKRYENLDKYLPTEFDYEYFFKKAFDDNNIPSKICDITFFKIRANKNIAWQGNQDCYGQCIKNKETYLPLYNKLQKELIK
jgi:hypothetical protein